MKLNVISNLALNYDKMSYAQKIQKAQELENMMAKLQGRKARNVTTKIEGELADAVDELKRNGRVPCAFYTRSIPRKLFLVEITNNPFDLIKDVIHEGWHAYVDDFISGRVKVLKTFAPIDKERFMFEEKNMEAIYNACLEKGMMQLYDSSFIEERTNYLEDALYMLKYIIDSADNMMDAMRLRAEIIFPISYYIENEKRRLLYEHEKNIKYDDIVAHCTTESNAERVDMSKVGRFVDGIDAEILEFFHQICDCYPKASNISNLISNNQLEKITDEIFNVYMNFMSARILKKIKS